MNNEFLENVYKNFENDNTRQAVRDIDTDVLADFWHDYRTYLDRLYQNKVDALFTFSEHVITYFRIKGRS